jgi:phage/plasmid-associated DNA primase
LSDRERSLSLRRLEAIRYVLEPALEWYAKGDDPQVAQQALRKLQEMRG